MKKIFFVLFAISTFSAFAKGPLSCNPSRKEIYFASAEKLIETAEKCQKLRVPGENGALFSDDGGIVYGTCRLTGFKADKPLRDVIHPENVSQIPDNILDDVSNNIHVAFMQDEELVSRVVSKEKSEWTKVTEQFVEAVTNEKCR